MKNVLVSVVIPSYKRADTVVRAINSVLNQTYPYIEILVVDDNIKGDKYSIKLKEVLSSIKSDRVRLIVQNCHVNGAKARNEGVKASKGEYIAFLDDDDEWLPEKVSKQVAILDNNPEVGGVSVLASMFLNGKLIHPSVPYSEDNMLFRVFLREVRIATSTFMCRKSVFNEIGGFDEELIRHQDLQLFVNFLNTSRIYPINESLVKMHADSTINRPSVEMLIEHKKRFFVSVRTVYDKLSPIEKKRVSAAHCFEVIYTAFREKKYLLAFNYLLKVGFCIEAYKDLIRRFRERY